MASGSRRAAEVLDGFRGFLPWIARVHVPARIAGILGAWEPHREGAQTETGSPTPLPDELIERRVQPFDPTERCHFRRASHATPQGGDGEERKHEEATHVFIVPLARARERQRFRSPDMRTDSSSNHR